LQLRQPLYMLCAIVEPECGTIHDHTGKVRSFVLYARQAEVQQLAARLAALTTDPLRRMRAFWLGSKCFQTFPEATFHLEVMGLDSMARVRLCHDAAFKLRVFVCGHCVCGLSVCMRSCGCTILPC